MSKAVLERPDVQPAKGMERIEDSEYFLFDPDPEELSGYRRVEGKYRALRPDGTVLQTLQEMSEALAERDAEIARLQAELERLREP